MIAWGRPLLASFFGAVLLPYLFSVAAAEDEVVDGIVEADAGNGAGLSQALELKRKLAMLSNLIDAKSGKDPEMMKKLDGLQEQLGKLGKTLGMEMELPASATEELEQYVAACLVMALQNVGPRTPSATGALRRLAVDGFTQGDAKHVELIRLVGICLIDLTDEEYDLYKAKKMPKLSSAYVSKAKTSAGRDAVFAIEDEIWAMMRKLAKEWVKQFGGNFDTEESSSAKSSSAKSSSAKSSSLAQVNAAASSLGLLALIPIISIAGFLTKKFLDQQKELDSKKESKKAKKQK